MKSIWKWKWNVFVLVFKIWQEVKTHLSFLSTLLLVLPETCSLENHLGDDYHEGDDDYVDNADDEDDDGNVGGEDDDATSP